MTEEQINWYKELADETGFSSHFLMQQAIRGFRTRIEKDNKMREMLVEIGGGDGKET